MKKITLLVASILLFGSVVKASDFTTVTGDENRRNGRFDQPISFVERGIEFFVFPNGDFDFNTRPQDSQGDYYYRTAGQRNGASVNRRPVNYGVLIEHDSFGRVRRIGNTFINYDYLDRVYRIGSVYMRYNRFGLNQVGGMQIVYNHCGDIIATVGEVNRFRNYAYTYQSNVYYCTNYVPANYGQNGYYYKNSDSKQ